MARTQTIYNILGAYIGPISSGFHFISELGVLNNNWSDTGSYSLVFPLNRITNASWSINNVDRQNISHLGNLGTIKRPILNNTEISLSLSYYLMGLVNEVRMGFYCNVPSGNPLNGPLIFGTGRKSPIYGFYSRNTSGTNDTDFNYPLITREPRNIFFGIQRDLSDFNRQATGTTLNDLYRTTDVNCLAFGDCYMTSYNCSAGVNQIPSVSVSYVCNNIEMYGSGIDCTNPSINPQTYNPRSGIKFSLPNNFQGSGLPTVLLPKDISVTIQQRSNSSQDLDDLFLDFTDIKLQDFSFDINLPRTPLYNVGYKYPMDKVIQFPVISNLSFNLLPGQEKAGSLVSLIKRDENYDVSIKLNYQTNTTLLNGTAMQFDFIGAKFNGFDSNVSVQSRQSNSLSFTTELDPLDTTRGLFMTGYLSIPNTALAASFLIGDFDFDAQFNDVLLMENLDLFALSLGGYKVLY